jgi:segregation and condensation protein B
MTAVELKAIVEGLLFVSEVPVTLDRFCELLPEYGRSDIRGVLDALTAEYSNPARGINLTQVANGYQFRTAAATADYLKRLHRAKPFRFSQSALETLAIIAYRQPVTRAEIESLRGVDTGGVLKTLLEKKLVRILGKKDVPGRPLIYGTTREFLELFSLRDLASLPSLRDVGELERPEPLELQEELPLLPPGEEGEGDNA